MADEVLKYSDIIRPDNSLEDLIAQMAEVIRVNKDMVSVLSNGADKVSKSMGSMSGATQQGRQAIDEAARTAERLQKAYDSLTTIINDTDRQMSSVRNRLLSLNGATDTQKKDIERLAGAYAKLKGDMAGLASSYEKLLSSGKAEGWWGDKMLQNVQKYERDIKSLNAELGSQAKALLQVQQAQERYSYSQSEEARIVEELNQKTKELLDSRKREAAASKQTAEATKKLAEAKRINAEANETYIDNEAQVLAGNQREIQIAELQKKANAENVDSYNRLSLEYEKVRIQLNAMSQAERESTETGIKLEEEAVRLYTEMQKLKGQTKAIVDERKREAEESEKAIAAERRLAEAKQSVQNIGKGVIDAAAQENAAIQQTLQLGELQKKAEGEKVGSYNRTAAEYKQVVLQLNAMSQAERESTEVGQRLQEEAVRLYTEMQKLKGATKDIIDGRKREAKANEQAAAAVLKLAEAKRINATASRDSEDYTARVLAENEREIQIAELQKKINAEKIGSYNRLSLEYQKVKIQLNAMSAAERETTDSGKKLEEEAMQLYTKMQMLQEATGKHTLSVGNYGKGFDMLRFEVNQVMRELPSLAVSLNQFFLAISNNIPMVVDQIQRANRVNAVLRQEGKKTVSVGKQVVAAILSWQTALVVGLTLLSKYGKNITEWIGQMIRGRDAVMKLSKALKNVTENIEKVDGGNSKNIITVMRLSEQWKKLNTEAEKAKWLKDHQSDFKEIGLAIDSVNKAESLFVQNTSMVLTAYAKRAAAAAAEALAQEKIKEAIEKQARAASLSKQEGLGTDDYRDAVRQAIARDNAAAKGLGINIEDASEISDEVVDLIDNLARLQNEYEDLQKGQNNFAKGLAAVESGASRVTTANEEAEKLKVLAQQIKDTEDLIKKATGAQVLSFDSVKDIERRFRSVRSLQTIATRLLREGMQYFEIMRSFEGDYEKLLEEYGFGGGGKKGQRNITEPEKAMVRNVSTRSADAQRALITSNYEKSKQSLEDETAKRTRELQDIIRKNNKWLQGLASGEYTVDDAETMMGMTVEEIKDMNTRAAEAIVAIEKDKQNKLKDLEVQFAIDMQKLRNGDIQNRLGAVKAGSKEEYELQEQLINGQEAIELYELQLNHDENFEKDRTAIVAKYAKQRADLNYNWQLQELEMAKSVQELKLEAVSDSEQNLKDAYEAEIIELERKIELLKNEQLAPELRQDPALINKKYDRKQRQRQSKSLLAEFQRNQAGERADYSSGLTSGSKGGPGWKPNEYKMNRFDLKQKKEFVDYQLKLWEQGLLELTDAEVKEYEVKQKELETEIKKSGPLSSFAEHGLFGGVLEQMGLDHEQIDAMNAAKDVIIDALNEIAEAEVEAAQKAVDAQQERVDAAQNAYEAEVQARANGYANNVATAKKEMEAEKKRLAQKQKLLEQAERRKEALDSLSQVSSLVTATAQIWQAFSGIGPWGIALAAVATAGMFSAFIASKVKAKQVASAEYGEGGLEFLEGGSHASGDDIDLGTRNRKGRRMRAEGGEAMAIINKRQTRRYRKALPGIIDSLNKGVFEEKYLKVFDGAQGISLQQNNTAQVDLSRLERDVQGIRKAGEERSYMMPDGTLVVQRGNVKRYIRR